MVIGPGIRPIRREAASRCRSVCFGRHRDALTIYADLPGQAVEELGAPEQIELVVRAAGSHALDLCVIMWRKPAKRMPEQAS